MAVCARLQIYIYIYIYNVVFYIHKYREVNISKKSLGRSLLKYRRHSSVRIVESTSLGDCQFLGNAIIRPSVSHEMGILLYSAL